MHVEDEDLFFEDDVAEEEPGPEEKPKPRAKAPAKRPAGEATRGKVPGKAAAQSGSKASSAETRTAPAETEEDEAVAPNTVNLTVAVLMMVITFLVGFVGGTLMERNRSAAPGAAGASQDAPALSQEQLNQGQLPPGHPSIGGMGTGGDAEGAPGAQPGGSTGSTGSRAPGNK